VIHTIAMKYIPKCMMRNRERWECHTELFVRETTTTDLALGCLLDVYKQILSLSVMQ